LACHLQIDADPDPAYHFDVDPDFYLIRMRIQVTKMMRIHNTGSSKRKTDYKSSSSIVYQDRPAPEPKGWIRIPKKSGFQSRRF
jgi:hypothetical protein